jgi:hypothetical protein
MGSPTPRAIVWLLCVALASIPGAAPAAPDPARQATDLLELSGLEAQLESLPPQVLQGIQSSPLQLGPDLGGKLVALVQEEYAPERVRRDIVARLATEMDADRATRAIEWFRSPAGTRLRRAEEAASTAEAMAGMQAFARRLALSGPTPERLALVTRIDTASRSTDLVLDTIFSTALAVALTLGAAQESAATAEEIMGEFEAPRAQMRPEIQETVRISYLYAYRDLTDAELDAYATFLESDPGRWYSRAVSRAFLGALTGSAKRLGTGFRRHLDVARARQML